MAAEIKRERGIDTILHKGSGGQFEVVLDGQLLFSKKQEGRFPELQEILSRLPEGPIRKEVPLGGEVREGMAIVEGFRGDVLVWLRLRNGLIERCHMRDPSWFQWPLLEAVIENNIVADFPLCNKSFNCSYSGHDL